MISGLESLSARITPTLFLLLAVGGALLVATPRGAGATSDCKPDGASCKTNQSCCTGVCTAHVCGTPTTTTSTTSSTTTSTTTTSSTTTTTTMVPTAQACPTECTPITCAAQGDLCEPCLGAGRGGSPGAGSCQVGIEGGLRCQVAGCAQPASN